MDNILADLLTNRDVRWSVGTPRAMLGFTPSGRLMRHKQQLCAVSDSGMLALNPSARLLAFETISADPLSWGHGVALLVPDPGPIPARTAMRRENDGSIDLGLGDGVVCASFHPEGEVDVDNLIRGSYGEAQAALERVAGRWVVKTEIAMIEVTTSGGHPVLHSMPKVAIRYPPTTPVPSGFVPAAHIFPRHPLRAGVFDQETHNAFQTLLHHHGRPELQQVKRAVRDMLKQGQSAPRPLEIANDDPHSRAAVRVALRQWWHETGRTPPKDWTRDWDPAFHRALIRQGVAFDA